MRQFEIVVDEPAEVGGTDEGPQPTELFLASLASCFAMSVAHVARKRGIELADLSVVADGEYDGPRFARLRLVVRSSHPRPALDEIARRAVSYCYISNTLAHRPAVEVRIGEE